MRLARDSGVIGKGAIPELFRAGLAAFALMTITGFGLTRMLLPSQLRRYEPLWVMPVGACATGVTMTVLGFAYVPFRVSLAIVLLGGFVLGAVALRREGFWPQPLPLLKRSAWPAYVAVVVACIALIPLFRAGFATVEGYGQDAHLAVGTAIFLQRHPPRDVAVQEAVDRVPLVWGSKQAIYYVLAANASLAGLEVHQTISTTAAILLAMACCGFFLLVVECLRGPPWAGLVAMGLVGMDRMVLHTVMHPYFNQTWGFFAMSFAFVLSWWLVRERTRGGIALLALFWAIVFLSYPLAYPIAAIPLLFIFWENRKRFSPRRAFRGKRSLLWMVPAGLILLIPIGAGLEKVSSAQNVVFSDRSLSAWGGDLTGYYPEPRFLAMNTSLELLILGPLLLWAIWLALREQPVLLKRSLWTVLGFGLVFAIYFRLRETGYYFHFKTLAFVAPVALAIAAAGFARMPRRWMGVVASLVMLGTALASARAELGQTFDQLPKADLELRKIDKQLPAGKSIRLDVDPQRQNWVAFMLHGQPLCSQKPLLNTSYPHVPTARRADYILTAKGAPVPTDAASPNPVTRLETWTLYRAKPDLPGPDRCSQRMVQTVLQITT